MPPPYGVRPRATRPCRISTCPSSHLCANPARDMPSHPETAYRDRMPRKPREEIPGGFFHLAARSVDGANVFREANDRLILLALLHGVVQRYDWRCQSYCLMTNHFHLIVRTMRPTLSRGMQALCGTYGLRFNKRYERCGHLFGGRFMSVAITSDEHLLEAHRYVARNPVRAGLCARPSDWRWSSYRAIVDLDAPFAFLDVDGVFRVLDDRPAIARELFRHHIEADRSRPAGPYKLARIDGV